MFVASKVIGALLEPANLLLVVLLCGNVLLYTRRRQIGRLLLGMLTAILLALAILPWSAWLVTPLEDRFAAQASLPDRVDGIVVLGGAFDPVVSAARAQPSANGAIERVTAMVELARRYPDAKLVFSGGSGAVTTQELKEAPVARAFLTGIGFDANRVMFEAQSRNTWENAVLSKDLSAPMPGEIWLLVTSATHMPRAMGAFRAAGWPMRPYPVDYSTSGGDSGLGFSLGRGLGALGVALHEWQGLLYYRLRGWNDTLYPGPAAPL